MDRIRRSLTNYRITPIGWVFIVVTVAALGAGFFGPHALRIPGLVIGFVGLAMMVAENAGMGRSVALRTERRGRFADPTNRQSGEPKPLGEPAAVEADEEAWRRERERRDASGR